MKIILFLTLLLCTQLMFSQTITVKTNEQVFGGGKIYHYFGEKGQWNPNFILSKRDEFELLTVDLVAKNPSDEMDWLYFEVSNPDSLVIWMNLGNDRVSRAQLYKLDDQNKIIDSLETGLETDNDFRPWGEFSFWLPLMKNDEYVGRYLIGFYSKVGNHEFRPSFGTKDVILVATRYDQIFNIMYTGIMLIMVFYNLILARTLRDKIYLFYSINLIAIYFGTTYAAHFPVIALFLGETIAHNYMVLWMGCLFISMSLFTTTFFNLSKTAPTWYRILWGVTALSIINGFLVFLIPSYIVVTIFILLLLSLYAISTLIGINQIKKKHPLAKLFVLAWVIVFLGVAIYFCVTLLGLFYNDVCYYANYISTSLEAAIFSVALGQRYRIIMKNEQETARLLSLKNDALLLSNKSLDSFNYHVSHDLKSVLVNTGSLNKMIKKYAEKDNKEKVISISDKLDSVIDKGQNTIQGFLSLGKSLTRTDQSIERLNVKQEILNIVKDNGLDVIELNFEFSDFEFLNINKTAFESIFLNLLTNSIKYSIEKPIATIQLKKLDRKPQIIYSDNGVGVDLEQFEDDLFSPFKRVENNLDQEGSGVGLYLVKRIITNYEGSITPYSELGKGLTFNILLPELMIAD